MRRRRSHGVTQGKTILKVVYRIAGSPEAGLVELAPAMDRMITEQVGRLVLFTET